MEDKRKLIMNDTASGFERLSRDFNNGYRKAYLDIMEIYGYIKSDLKYHRKTLTTKQMDKLLKCISNNRANIRDNIGKGFIRYNNQLEDFEYYIPREHRR